MDSSQIQSYTSHNLRSSSSSSSMLSQQLGDTSHCSYPSNNNNNNNKSSSSIATATIVVATEASEKSKTNTNKDGSTTTTRSDEKTRVFLQVLWGDLFPALVAPFLCVEDILVVGNVSRGARQAALLRCVWLDVATRHFRVDAVSLESDFTRVMACCTSAINVNASTDEDMTCPLLSSPTRGDATATAEEASSSMAWPDSLLPTPTERADMTGSPTAAPCMPADGDGCDDHNNNRGRIPSSLAHLVQSSPLGLDVQDMMVVECHCSSSCPTPTTASSSSALTPLFPWRQYVLWLNENRVTNFMRHVQTVAHQLSRGDALSRLNYMVHNLMQGGCVVPAHAQLLADCLLQRAALQPTRQLALEDRVIAEALTGDAELSCLIEDDLAMDEGAAHMGCWGGNCSSTSSLDSGTVVNEEPTTLCQQQQEAAGWATDYDVRACTARPLAGLCAWRRYVASSDVSRDDVSPFAALVMMFIEVQGVLGWRSSHLLGRAARLASNSCERLLVQALSKGGEAGEADADVASGVLPLSAARDQLHHVARQWLDSCILNSGSDPLVALRLAHSTLAASLSSSTRVTLLLPALVGAHCVEGSPTLVSDKWLHVLLLTNSARCRAMALTRVATCCAQGELRSAPGLPMRLLEAAVQLDWFYTPAALHLARACADGGDVPRAYKVLSECIHRYAPQQRRSGRCPTVVYVPAELLAERSSYRPHTAVADIAEAIRHNPRYSYPYCVLAHTAQRAGNSVLAAEQLCRVLRLTMNSLDAALALHYVSNPIIHHHHHHASSAEGGPTELEPEAVSEEHVLRYCSVLAGLRAPPFTPLENPSVMRRAAHMFWQRLVRSQTE